MYMGCSARRIEAQLKRSIKDRTFFSSKKSVDRNSMLHLLLSMESSSSSTSSNFLSYWNFLNFILFRPVLAILFVLSFIVFWWLLAWKSVLVHVPLVQEIFGLKKKPVKPKPPARRLSRYYNRINAHNSTSE